MNIRFSSFSGSVKSLRNTIIVLATLALTAIPFMAQASTMAGTSVANTVTVTYKSQGGVQFSASQTVTVTVTLVKAAPVIAFVSQLPAATVGAPTDEATPVVQTYNIYAQANGPVLYTVNNPVYTPTTIGAATPAAVAAPFYLGATTVAIQAAAGTVIYVPYDGTADGSIGGANGITTSSQLWINSNSYGISAIVEDTTADAGIPVDMRGKVSKITLSAAFTGSTLQPGTIIGEYKIFTQTVTTGVFATGVSIGSYAGSINVTDGTNTSNNALSSINVARANLDIKKEVSVDGGATYSSLTVPTAPGKELWYRITVTNPSLNKTVNTVSLVDVLSPYVAFKLASFTFTPGSSNLTLVSATTTYQDQTNTAYTPVSGGGGAPAGYDALVSNFTIAFTAQTMAVNSNFVLVYHVWLY